MGTDEKQSRIGDYSPRFEPGTSQIRSRILIPKQRDAQCWCFTSAPLYAFIKASRCLRRMTCCEWDACFVSQFGQVQECGWPLTRSSRVAVSFTPLAVTFLRGAYSHWPSSRDFSFIITGAPSLSLALSYLPKVHQKDTAYPCPLTHSLFLIKQVNLSLCLIS
jgi:hypothetical protein